jgi:Protein of unknown function (DUF3562)
MTSVNAPGWARPHTAWMNLDNQLERERTSQVNSVRKFARDRAVPEEFAIAVYEWEWQRLYETARVRRFVGILAEKRAKDAVRNNG